MNSLLLLSNPLERNHLASAFLRRIRRLGRRGAGHGAFHKVGHLVSCSLLHLRGDMGVHIQSETGATVAQHTGHRFGIDTIGECQCCEGVAQVVESNTFVQTDCLQNLLVQSGDSLRTPDASGSGRGEQVDAVGMILPVLYQ